MPNDFLTDEEMSALDTENAPPDFISDDDLGKFELPDVSATQKKTEQQKFTHTENYPAVSKVDPKAIPEALIKHGASGITLGASTRIVPWIEGRNREDYLAELDELREKAPLASSIGEVLGALALPGPKKIPLSPQASRVKKLLQASRPALVGGAEAGIYGAMTGRGAIGSDEQIKDFLTSAPLGVAGVAGAQGAGALAGKTRDLLTRAAKVPREHSQKQAVKSLMSGSGKKMEDELEAMGVRYTGDPEGYIKELGEHMQQEGMVKFGRTPLKTQEEAIKSRMGYGGQIGEIYNQIDAKVGDTFSLYDFADRLRKDAASYQGDATQGVKKKLLDSAAFYEQKALERENPFISLREAQKWKNEHDFRISTKGREVLEPDQKQWHNQMNRNFSKQIEDTVGHVNTGDVNGYESTQNAILNRMREAISAGRNEKAEVYRNMLNKLTQEKELKANAALSLPSDVSLQSLKDAKKKFGYSAMSEKLASDKASRIRKNNIIGLRAAILGGALGAGAGYDPSGVDAGDLLLTLSGATAAGLAQRTARQSWSRVLRGMMYLLQKGDPAIKPFEKVLRSAADKPQAFAVANYMLLKDNPEYQGLVNEILNLPMEGQENGQQRTDTINQQR